VSRAREVVEAWSQRIGRDVSDDAEDQVLEDLIEAALTRDREVLVAKLDLIQARLEDASDHLQAGVIGVAAVDVSRGLAAVRDLLVSVTVHA
jgi:transcriptional regulator CtsR